MSSSPDFSGFRHYLHKEFNRGSGGVQLDIEVGEELSPVKAGKQPTRAVISDSESGSDVEIIQNQQDLDEIQFTGSSSPAHPAWRESKRKHVRDRQRHKQREEEHNTMSGFGNNRRAANVARTKSGSKIACMDPEAYPERQQVISESSRDPPKRKKNSVPSSGFEAGRDTLYRQDSPMTTNATQGFLSGARAPSFLQATANPSFSLSHDQHQKLHAQGYGNSTMFKAANLSPANVQTTSSRGRGQPGSSTSAYSKSRVPELSIKGNAQRLRQKEQQLQEGVGRLSAKDKGKGKAREQGNSTVIELDSDGGGEDDEIQDANGSWETDVQPSTSSATPAAGSAKRHPPPNKDLHSSATRVAQPGRVKQLAQQIEGNRVKEKPAVADEDGSGDDLGISGPTPAMGRGKGKKNLVGKMVGRSEPASEPAGKAKSGASSKKTARPSGIKHLPVKELVSEVYIGSETTRLAYDADKGELIILTAKHDELVRLSIDDLDMVCLQQDSKAELKQGIAWMILSISAFPSSRSPKALLKKHNCDTDLAFLIQFDTNHPDWDLPTFEQIKEFLLKMKNITPTSVEYIKSTAFHAQKRNAQERAKSHGATFEPKVAGQPTNTLDKSFARQREQQKKEALLSELGADVPLLTRSRKANLDQAVELSDSDDEDIEDTTMTLEPDLSSITRPTSGRRKARPSAGARKEKQDSLDSEHVPTVASKPFSKRTIPQDDTSDAENVDRHRQSIGKDDFYSSSTSTVPFRPQGKHTRFTSTARSTSASSSDANSNVPVVRSSARIAKAPSMDQAERSKVVAEWKRPFDGPDDKICLVHPPSGKGSITITLGDFDRLKPDEYLNDTLVEYGMKGVWEELLQSPDNAANRELAEQIHVFSSFFYKKLSTQIQIKDSKVDGYSSVRKWTQKIDIFSKKYIFLPINENFHWYLAIIVNPGRVLRPPPPASPKSPVKRRKTRSSLDSESLPPNAADRVESPYFTAKNEKTKVVGQGQIDLESEEGHLNPGLPAKENLIEMVVDAEDENTPTQPVLRSAKTAPSSSSSSTSDESSDSSDEARVTATSDTKPSIVGASTSDQPLARREDDTVMTQSANLTDNKLEWPPAAKDDMCYIITLDSLGSNHKAVGDRLKRYLRSEAVDKGKAPDEEHVWTDKGVVKYIAGKCPEQHNMSDCGLYVMHFTKVFLEKPDILPYLTQHTPPPGIFIGKSNPIDRKRVTKEIWDYEDALDKRQELADEIRQKSFTWATLKAEEDSARRQRRIDRQANGAEGQSAVEGDSGDADPVSEAEDSEGDIEIVEARRSKTPSPKKARKRPLERESTSDDGGPAGNTVRAPTGAVAPPMGVAPIRKSPPASHSRQASASTRKTVEIPTMASQSSMPKSPVKSIFKSDGNNNALASDSNPQGLSAHQAHVAALALQAALDRASQHATNPHLSVLNEVLSRFQADYKDPLMRSERAVSAGVSKPMGALALDDTEMNLSDSGQEDTDEEDSQPSGPTRQPGKVSKIHELKKPAATASTPLSDADEEMEASRSSARPESAETSTSGDDTFQFQPISAEETRAVNSAETQARRHFSVEPVPNPPRVHRRSSSDLRNLVHDPELALSRSPSKPVGQATASRALHNSDVDYTSGTAAYLMAVDSAELAAQMALAPEGKRSRDTSAAPTSTGSNAAYIYSPPRKRTRRDSHSLPRNRQYATHGNTALPSPDKGVIPTPADPGASAQQPITLDAEDSDGGDAAVEDKSSHMSMTLKSGSSRPLSGSDLTSETLLESVSRAHSHPTPAGLRSAHGRHSTR